MNDEGADEVEQHMNWDAIAERLKQCEDIHRVVIRGVSKDIDITDPKKPSNNVFKEINCTNPDAIAHMTPLRRNPTKAKRRSIIVFSKDLCRGTKRLDRKRLYHQLQNTSYRLIHKANTIDTMLQLLWIWTSLQRLRSQDLL
jgi:hypothetical protein